MWTFIHMLLAIEGDEDSPLNKIMPFIHGANFIGSSFSTVSIILIGLLLVFLPSLLILSSSSSFQDEAVEYMKMYETVVDIQLVDFMESNAEQYKTSNDCDIVEVNNFTMITPEMLIAFDNTRFEGDYTKTTKRLITNTVIDMLSTSYEIVEINETRDRKKAVTDSNGNFKTIGGVGDDILILADELKAEHPSGYTTTENGVTYYNYSVKIVLYKAIVTYNSLSFEEALIMLDFNDEEITLARSYYTVMNERIVLFGGGSGNYKFADDLKLFLAPVQVIYPLTENMYVRMTSGYGYREYYLNGVLQKGIHNGVDFGLPTGTPIVATADGIVTRVSYSPTEYGHWIEIDHGNGYKSRYAHNNSVSVSVGEQVVRGDMIAISGNTGKSTGAHLHFEIRLNDNPIDPLPLINLQYEESE